MAKARPITNLDAQAPTGTNARLIVRTRLEELYEWVMYVDDPYHVHELHNLRIAAKRLRYTLEVFSQALPEECGIIIKEMQQIQEELGALHDSDVMMALLRLCLGSLDSGTGYENALVNASFQQGKGPSMLNPDMVAHLLDPAHTPSAEQRQGLEHLLFSLQKEREEHYTNFRKHWYQLQERDFRREALAILDNNNSS
jgi:hypothetical protein